MHPIYSAFIKRHLFSTVIIFIMFIAGVTAMIWSLSLLSNGGDSAIIYLIPAAIMTLSAADVLRNRFFKSRKKLKNFLSKITPEQNARILAEFRPNPGGEILAGDFLILLGRQMEFIRADSLSISSAGGRTSVSGCDINERYDDWFIDDEDVIRQVRRLIHDRRRSVVCAGGRR